jgi:hypothetical protein
MAGFVGVDALAHINNTTIDLAPVTLTPSAHVDAIERTSVIREFASSVDSPMRGVGGLAIAEGYGLGALASSVLNTFAPRRSTRLARTKNPVEGCGWCTVSGLPPEEAQRERRIPRFPSCAGGARME